MGCHSLEIDNSADNTGQVSNSRYLSFNHSSPSVGIELITIVVVSVMLMRRVVSVG